MPARDAFERLTANRFDASYDRHNISQGYYDPVQHAASADLYGGNVPYLLDDLPVADRPSFYFLSKCFLTAPGSQARYASDDLRNEPCVEVFSSRRPRAPARPGGRSGYRSPR